MAEKPRLELTWIGKDQQPKLEPRILLEDSEKSYGDASSQNMLIHGDNLLALKALEHSFTGKVKCIYIDPPYNTKSAFESYDDNIEHSIWLTLMKARLEILWKLLSNENGTILISINDDECHYLKVICDEIFERKSFVASLIWNYEGNTDNQAKIINYHEYILVYSKTGDIDDPKVIDPNVKEDSKLFKEEIRNTIVKNGPKNPLKTILIPAGFPCSFEEGAIKKKDVTFPRYSADINVKDFKTEHSVDATSGWSSRKIFEEFIRTDFNVVKDSKGQLTSFEIRPSGAIEAFKKREQNKGHFLSVLRGFGTTNQMRLFLEKLGLKFTYPKPIDLIAYLIEAFSGKDDFILDSFAGSGTTAHSILQVNMNKKSTRKFILVEIEDKNAYEVILPRLKFVVDGVPSIELQPHGGGFRFYELAPSLLKQDKYGNLIIEPEYNAEMLAAAMCKHENFRFNPDEQLYWKQGKSTEKDFIFTTTSFITVEHLDKIHEEMQAGESLLICCKSFQEACENRFPNITIKKIPQMLLGRCEFAKDDYSLNIINLPSMEEATEEELAKVEESKSKYKSKKKAVKITKQTKLFS